MIPRVKALFNDAISIEVREERERARREFIRRYTDLKVPIETFTFAVRELHATFSRSDVDFRRSAMNEARRAMLEILADPAYAEPHPTYLISNDQG